MATVKIDKFGGIAPRQHPTQLADGMATVAMNVVLESGKLVPLRQPRLVEGAANIMENGLADVADAESLHIWRKNLADGGGFDFLLFPGMTWTAPGNIASDDLTRIIVSGETGVGTSGAEPVIYVRSSGAKVVKRLAKTALAAPVVSRVSTEELSENKRYTRFFVAWVDEFGFESPVSEPSLLKQILKASDGWSVSGPTDGEYTFSKSGETDIVLDEDEVTITMSTDSTPVFVQAEYAIDEDLEYDDGDEIAVFVDDIPEDAVTIRVYKVITGMEEGRGQFVIDKTATEATGGFTVAVKDEDAGEVMPEIENPPDGLQSILDVPGAFYVGFVLSTPKTVCFSEVDMLYSWPLAYRYDIADNIVALAVTSNSVYALTDGWPYVLSGTAPESMTVAKLANPAACVSVRGVTVLKNTVFYASNAGLMAIANSANEGTVVTNLTEQIFTKDQWQALNPKSCLLGHHKGRLFMYFATDDGGVYGSAVSFLDPDGSLGLARSRFIGLTFNLTDGLGVAVTAHDEAAKCLVVDNAEDKMYYVREGV